MTTAVQVAERALKRILVQADDAPLDPSDYADFYDSMNSFMAGLEGDGVRLGYTEVTNPSDTITIPSSAIRGLVANMAVEVAPDYGVQVSAALMKQAMDGLRQMKVIGRTRVETSYPAGLPMGGGREDYVYSLNPLYGVIARAILHLENSEGLVTTLTATPVRLQGYWSIGESKGLTADITGRLVNNTRYTITVTVEAAVKGTAADSGSYSVYLMNSGVIEETVSETAAAADAELTFAVLKSVEVKPGGTLELMASGADNMTFFDSTLEVY